MSATCLRARWILPIDRPVIRDGWVHVAQGRVVALGTGRPPAPADDLGDVALLPGLVNAHTHLELSWMEGLVPPAASMDAWIRALIAVRNAAPAAGEADRLAAAARAALSMHASGTVLVGDISNTLTSPAAIAMAGLDGVVFHEVIGFNVVAAAARADDAWARVDRLPDTGARVRGSVVAHAPYSVAPALITAIAERQRETPIAMHLGESFEEIEFLRTGRGPFRALLEGFGTWVESWPVPSQSPVAYIDALGYLRPGLLAVHGVHLRDGDLTRLRDAGAVLVTCPRSNEWVGAGLPQIGRFYASGVPVALGTDSLASVASLRMFDELAAMRRVAPDVAAASFLESATRVGAEALGFGADYGTLTPGKRAAFAVVEAPADTADVEEYLVSGVAASAVRLHVHS